MEGETVQTGQRYMSTMRWSSPAEAQTSKNSNTCKRWGAYCKAWGRTAKPGRVTAFTAGNWEMTFVDQWNQHSSHPCSLSTLLSHWLVCELSGRLVSMGTPFSMSGSKQSFCIPPANHLLVSCLVPCTNAWSVWLEVEPVIGK